MWLAEKTARSGAGAPDAAVGEITIGGESPAVLSEGESRGVLVLAPGGYVWKPSPGEETVVLRCGSVSAAAGAVLSEWPAGLACGEVCVRSAGGASVLLKNDGSVEITGSVNVTGALRVNGKTVTVA